MLLALVSACASSPTSAGRTLRVVSYNIRHGAGMDHVIDLTRAAAVINALAPDVVALQEVDQGCTRTDGVDQARRLGALCGMQPVFGSFMDYDGGRYGMALLTRHPLRASFNQRLPPGSEPRSALTATVQLDGDGQELVLVGVHLYETESQRLAQAHAILRAQRDETRPVLLVGDFNSRPGSPVMELLEAEFTNVAKRGERLTYPADAPEREIDFILLRPAAAFAELRSWVVDEPRASDHRPVVLDAVLR